MNLSQEEIINLRVRLGLVDRNIIALKVELSGDDHRRRQLEKFFILILKNYNRLALFKKKF